MRTRVFTLSGFLFSCKFWTKVFCFSSASYGGTTALESQLSPLPCAVLPSQVLRASLCADQTPRGLAPPSSPSWNPELPCLGGDKGINIYLFFRVQTFINFYTLQDMRGSKWRFFMVTWMYILISAITGSVLLMRKEYGIFHCPPEACNVERTELK